MGLNVLTSLRLLLLICMFFYLNSYSNYYFGKGGFALNFAEILFLVQLIDLSKILELAFYREASFIIYIYWKIVNTTKDFTWRLNFDLTHMKSKQSLYRAISLGCSRLVIIVFYHQVIIWSKLFPVKQVFLLDMVSMNFRDKKEMTVNR